MINKIQRHLLLDLPVQLHVIVLVVVMAIFLGQSKTLSIQSRQLAEIKKKQALIAQIPEMEAVLKKKDPQISERVIISKEITYVLEGITIEGGSYFALINGKIYKKGDSLDDFLILDVGREKVVFLNIKTNVTKNLYFTKFNIDLSK